MRGGAHGAQPDGEPQHARRVPLVVALVREGLLLVLGEVGEHEEVLRVARHEGRAPEEVGFLRHVVPLGEGAGVRDGFRWCRALLGGGDGVSGSVVLVGVLGLKGPLPLPPGAFATNMGRILPRRRGAKGLGRVGKQAYLQRVLDDVDGARTRLVVHLGVSLILHLRGGHLLVRGASRGDDLILRGRRRDFDGFGHVRDSKLALWPALSWGENDNETETRHFEGEA